jgi:hypothetical protein
MSSSTYYWSRRLIKGFGKMWFLIVPQEANSDGGGTKLLGSVVEEVAGQLFPGGNGINIIGKDFPKPERMTTPQLLLKAIESRRKALSLEEDEQLIAEIKFPDLNVVFEKSDALKSNIGDFPGLPSLPVSLEIDYARMERVSIQFGANTRKLYIPTGYLSRLKNFVGGDDHKITTDFSIAKEAIVNQILLTDRYSITFESISAFDPDFEADVSLANTLKAGKISVELEQTTHRQVTVTVNDGNEYLIALRTIDWDDL